MEVEIRNGYKTDVGDIGDYAKNELRRWILSPTSIQSNC